MKKYLIAACLLIAVSATALSAQVSESTVVELAPGAQVIYGDFKVYLMIKAGRVKKSKKPEFAYRELKSYPSKVREFLLSSKYTSITRKESKLKADNLIYDLSGNKNKNAVLVAAVVYDYVNLSITARQEETGPCLTQSQCYALPEDVLESGQGHLIEKNRLAIALLKYFSIPARMAYWEDHYVVQYFLKPLESEKIDAAWHIMDFTGAYEAAKDKVEPVAWHPVTSEELLGEIWEGENINLVKKHVINTHMEINEAEALAIFTNIERGNIVDLQGNTTFAGRYILKEITYSLTAPAELTAVKMELTLPFNESQPFKTLRYFVSGSGNLKPKFRKTHTMINPPNSGLVYTLPVEFEFIAK